MNSALSRSMTMHINTWSYEANDISTLIHESRDKITDLINVNDEGKKGKDNHIIIA